LNDHTNNQAWNNFGPSTQTTQINPNTNGHNNTNDLLKNLNGLYP